MNDTKCALLDELPPLRRARSWRLYTENGRKLVDLWQNDGAALLGHKPAGFVKTLKNNAERGLFAPLPSRHQRSVVKALGQCFSGKCFRLYRSAAALEDALSSNGSGPAAALPRWRPFSGIRGTEILQTAALFIPVIPAPCSPHILVLDPRLDGVLPPSDLISPFMLALTAAVLHTLAVQLKQGRTVLSRIARVCAADELWRQEGIYLYYQGTSSWDKVWRSFLTAGFLAPPDPASPLILPGELSSGEASQLAAVLAATP
jgi:hypothetical protein